MRMRMNVRFRLSLGASVQVQCQLLLRESLCFTGRFDEPEELRSTLPTRVAQ